MKKPANFSLKPWPSGPDVSVLLCSIFFRARGLVLLTVYKANIYPDSYSLGWLNINNQNPYSGFSIIFRKLVSLYWRNYNVNHEAIEAECDADVESNLSVADYSPDVTM